MAAFDLAQYAEPVEPGHLHVEANEVGLQVTNHRDGLVPGLGFPHNFYVSFILQQAAHSLTCQRLVIHDQNSHSYHLPSR
ncbi:hypothetical protein MASR1M101_40910 [Gemmatimonas sp.]